jgi:glycosyltransferase involved in cell wall biosynthesis
LSGVQRRLAVIVISFRGREDVVRAVRSLVAQDVEAEVLVVNSGGSSPERRLREAGLAVRVLDVARPLTPGGARNAGIAATSAPCVAFLAGDCWAAPGWVAARVREHEQGAVAVAARTLNPHAGNPTACAFHLAAHGRRLAAGDRLLGLSYTRAWLDRNGPFRDTTVTGEDNDMRSRLGRDARIAAPPDVVTFHDHPTELAELTREMVVRGRRFAEEARRHGRPPGRGPAALYAADNVAGAVAATLRRRAEVPAREVLLGLPLALPAAAALALGALVPARGRAEPRTAAEEPPQRRAESPAGAASAPAA